MSCTLSTPPEHNAPHHECDADGLHCDAPKQLAHEWLLAPAKEVLEDVCGREAALKPTKPILRSSH
jgi:hypothetical protein